MRTVVCKFGLVVVFAASLAACSDKPPRLMAHASGDGPDEFTVLPKKPLEQPKSYAELPVPTPGGANRTDVNPEEDVAIALGGSATAVTRSGISASDRGLIATASRYGVDPGIRETLAAEDLEFRKRNRGRIMYRLAGKDRYFDAYKRMTLDEQAEYERWQVTGVRTPTAPPPSE